jgi:hypothetical protein
VPRGRWPEKKSGPRRKHNLEFWQYEEIRRIWKTVKHGERRQRRHELAIQFDIGERSIERIVAGTQGRMRVHHYYYYDPKKIDLTKMRDDAQQRLDGTGHYRGGREESVIHHHNKFLAQATETVTTRMTNTPCDGQRHDYYNKDGIQLNVVADAQVVQS